MCPSLPNYSSVRRHVGCSGLFPRTRLVSLGTPQVCFHSLGWKQKHGLTGQLSILKGRQWQKETSQNPQANEPPSCKAQVSAPHVLCFLVSITSLLSWAPSLFSFPTASSVLSRRRVKSCYLSCLNLKSMCAFRCCIFLEGKNHPSPICLFLCL